MVRQFIFILVFGFGLNLFAGEKPQKIYIFYTNDIQGKIGKQKARFMNPNYPPVLGGGASAYNIIQQIRQKAGKNGDLVLLFDAGDFLSASSDLVRNSKGRAIIEFMNKMGYDAIVPGIDDFSFAGSGLFDLAKTADFPFVAANIKMRSGAAKSEPFLPSVIIEKKGVKIGVLGIISQSAQYIDDQEKIKDFEFLPELEAAKREVKRLKEAGCDLIIALAHLGLPYDAEEFYPVIREQDRQRIIKKSFLNTMELAHYADGIDLIFSGRIHRGYDKPWEDPLTHTLCFQNYAYGGNLGSVVLNLDPESKSFLGYDFLSEEGSLLLLTEDEFLPNPEMAEFIDSLQTAYSAFPDEIIGYTLNTLTRSSQGESPLGNLMSDAMLKASGADFAFNNFNSIRQNLPIGPITKQDLLDAFPFANELVVIEVKGSLLKDLMERSVVGSFMGVAIAGGRVVYDPKRPDGSRIVSFSIKGKPVEKDKIYRVATSSYIAEGNSGMTPLSFLPEKNFHFTGKLIRETVIEYIRKNSPLNIRVDGRWKRK